MIRNAPVTCLSNLHTAYPEPDRRLTHLAAVEIIGPHQQRDFFSRTVIEYQPNSFMHMFQQPDEGLLQHQMSLYQSLLLGLPNLFRFGQALMIPSCALVVSKGIVWSS